MRPRISLGGTSQVQDLINPITIAAFILSYRSGLCIVLSKMYESSLDIQDRAGPDELNSNGEGEQLVPDEPYDNGSITDGWGTEAESFTDVSHSDAGDECSRSVESMTSQTEIILREGLLGDRFVDFETDDESMTSQTEVILREGPPPSFQALVDRFGDLVDADFICQWRQWRRDTEALWQDAMYVYLRGLSSLLSADRDN